MTGPIRVAVVDDHAIFGELLQFAISCEPGLLCVGSATTAEQALDLCADQRPDVVVMDLQLGDAEVAGIELTRSVVERHDARVVVLTALKDHHLAAQAAAAGAVGFLQKDGSAATVIQAIRAAQSGLMVVAPSLLQEMAAQPVPQGPEVTLTARESEVLVLMAKGQGPAGIAQALGLSPHTVRTHLQSLMAKLGAHTRLDAVVTATRLGLVDPPQHP